MSRRKKRNTGAVSTLTVNLNAESKPNTNNNTESAINTNDNAESDLYTNSCNLFSKCSGCQEDISCFKKIAGVLSDAEIKKLKLIHDPIDENFNPTVYDLSLGSCHYVYGISKSDNSENKTKKSWIPVCIGSENEFNNYNKNLSQENKFTRQDKNRTNCLTIPPLGSALIQLDEIVDTYTIAEEKNILVTGRFDLKLTLVNKGLISQQGTQIEPCYEGRLYCFVHNLSNTKIDLTYKDPIASIEFSYVSCFCNEGKRKEVVQSLIVKNKNRYLNPECCEIGKGIMNVRYFNREKYLPDSCGLFHISELAVAAVKEENVINNITDKIKSKITYRVPIFVAIIGAASSILVSLITGYYSTLKPLNDRLDKAEAIIETHEEKLNKYPDEVKDLISEVIDQITNQFGITANSTTDNKQ